MSAARHRAVLTDTMVATLSHSLRNVVVYRNGALVTRRAHVAAGVDVAEVRGLPLTLASDSVRVRPVDGGSVGVVTVDEVCGVDVVEAAAPRDPAALVELRVQLDVAQAKIAALHTLLEHADIGVQLPPAEVDAAPDARVLAALHQSGRRRREALQAAIRSLNEELRVLRERQTAEQSKSRVDTTPPRVLRGLRVGLTGAGDVDVEYFVPAARWLPSYALHITNDEGGARARLVLGALIAQASGEDWVDVDVAVSTVDLRRDTTLPTLHSWRLGRAQPHKPVGFRPLPSDLPTLFAGYDRFPPPPSRPRQQPREPEPARPPPPPPPAPPPPAPPRARAAAPMVASAPAAAMAEMSALPSPKVMKRKEAAMDEADTPAADFAAGFGGPPGAGGGGGPLGAATTVVADELPPRLRTSAMRMVPADEGLRGVLGCLNATVQLSWLLDAHDLSVVGGRDVAQAELARAVNALHAAEQRLRERSLPRGTRPLGDHSVAAVYVAAGRATVPGDGNDHRVVVHVEEGPAEFVHMAVPRHAREVWRALPLRVAHPVPDGPVQVYEDGAFVVAGAVDGGGGGRPLLLNLGVDPDVRIKDRTPHTQQAEKGVLGGTTHVEHRVVTEIVSTAKVPVRLRVFDRIPVVDDAAKDLAVTAFASKPPAQRTDRGPDDRELKGGIRFDVTLMPGDPITLEHSYTLTLPAKSEVVGGNRRE